MYRYLLDFPDINEAVSTEVDVSLQSSHFLDLDAARPIGYNVTSDIVLAESLGARDKSATTIDVDPN